MRYIKIFMLTLLAGLCLASCSDDDGSINTNSVSGGFTTDTIVIKENTGIYEVPIQLNGYRNGDVKVEISAEGTGANPAQEGTNYRITDKTLSFLEQSDTTSTATLNVELQTIDDQDINENRELTLTITRSEGFTVTRSKVVVVLRDNDAAFYEKFFGKWRLQATLNDGSAVDKEVTISGPTDENDKDYDKVLYASCPGMFNIGASIDCDWTFNYTFNSQTKTGTLEFVQGELIASYGSSYQWCWLSNVDNYITTWSLDSNNNFPTTITFPTELGALYFYQPGAGWWRNISNITLTKE